MSSSMRWRSGVTGRPVSRDAMGKFLLLKKLHRPPPLRPGQTSAQARYLTNEHPCRASGFVLWV